MKKNSYSIPLWKRTFDIIGSSLLILALSPLFIVVAILIKLESKGPIFYSSKRAGQGYKVFDFYKFRSMRVGSDSAVKKLMENNQYAEGQPNLSEEFKAHLMAKSSAQLVSDDSFVQESDYLLNKKEKDKGLFFKMKDDPRITRVGRFIRSSSIDELPQLFNVLKGDMSLVGNRPLPLYEAQKLTADTYAMRFLAPAGITGLWQVEGRGKADLSEEDRKMLDVEYAMNYNLWMDIKILIKTPLAAIQKVNV